MSDKTGFLTGTGNGIAGMGCTQADGATIGSDSKGG
jgi:hypothetical protein